MVGSPEANPHGRKVAVADFAGLVIPGALPQMASSAFPINLTALLNFGWHVNQELVA
jgi:hypothetical protein